MARPGPEAGLAATAPTGPPPGPVTRVPCKPDERRRPATGNLKLTPAAVQVTGRRATGPGPSAGLSAAAAQPGRAADPGAGLAPPGIPSESRRPAVNLKPKRRGLNSKGRVWARPSPPAGCSVDCTTAGPARDSDPTRSQRLAESRSRRNPSPSEPTAPESDAARTRAAAGARRVPAHDCGGVESGGNRLGISLRADILVSESRRLPSESARQQRGPGVSESSLQVCAMVGGAVWSPPARALGCGGT
jgi:hypothetical protein